MVDMHLPKVHGQIKVMRGVGSGIRYKALIQATEIVRETWKCPLVILCESNESTTDDDPAPEIQFSKISCL